MLLQTVGSHLTSHLVHILPLILFTSYLSVGSHLNSHLVHILPFSWFTSCLHLILISPYQSTCFDASCLERSTPQDSLQACSYLHYVTPLTESSFDYNLYAGDTASSYFFHLKSPHLIQLSNHLLPSISNVVQFGRPVISFSYIHLRWNSFW